jgi:hypothetical protein
LLESKSSANGKSNGAGNAIPEKSEVLPKEAEAGE